MATTEPPSKRLKATPETTSPKSIVTWNCNGFVSRCKGDSKELKRLLVETKDPDCICLQEVRLKACISQRSKPMASEYEFVKPVMEELFDDNYDTYWSLADTRYAGTLTLLHKRLNFNKNDATIKTAFTPQTAITVLCQLYGVTREQVGLPEEARSAQPPPKKKATTQKSMTSFFGAKKKQVEATPAQQTQDHNSDGRFQCFFFPDMHLMQTYVPNNGMKAESFARRRAWDADMLLFVKQRNQVLSHELVLKQLGTSMPAGSATSKQPVVNTPQLLWCGDMNCAADYNDGTHWEHREENESYEWWTDESKCLMKAVKSKCDPNRSVDDLGMPSFTKGERRRFREIRSQARLLDIWRELHPDGSERTDLSQWDRPEWTWRGHLSANGYSKYEGKGQRLDYFLLSLPPRDGRDDDEQRAADIAEVVDRCEILGYGSKKEGLFCGSDHCASILVLKDATTEKDGMTNKAAAKGKEQETGAKYLDV